MKFVLRYDGRVKANGNATKKWELRKKFHPQLLELWTVNPILQQVLKSRVMPVDGPIMRREHHHTSPNADKCPAELDFDRVAPPGSIDLCEAIAVGEHRFMPLIRDSLDLLCGLKLTFLRKERPGKVYQGDLDNRIKTLLDALSVPQDAQQCIKDAPDPIFCLLENDRLISGLSVETYSLLSAPDADRDEVSFMIEVDVRVGRARLYNQSFLGG